MSAFVPCPPLGCPQAVRRLSSTPCSLLPSHPVSPDIVDRTSAPTTAIAPRKCANPAAAPHPSAHALPHGAGCGGDVAVVWLRSDLRVHDHAALHAAHASGLQVAPLYVLAGAASGDFARGALLALRRALRALGATLYVRRARDGNVAAAVAGFARDTAAQVVFAHRGVCAAARAQERAAHAALSSAGARLQLRWSGFLRDPDALPFPPAQTPADCDAYAAKVARVAVPDALPAPRALRGLQGDVDAGDVPQVPAAAAKGEDVGEEAAWRRVCEYVVRAGVADVAAGTRGGRSVDTKFGRLGPFLRLGCVSPRAVYHEVMRKVPKMSVKFYCAELELLLGDFVKMCQLNEEVHAAGCCS